MYRTLSIFLKNFDEEIKIACKASGIDVKDAPEEIDKFFSHVKVLAEDERLPDIALAELGTIKSTPSSIRRTLYLYKMQHRLGNVSKNFYKYVLSKYWYAYKRLVDYKFGKGGVINNKVGVGYFWTYVPYKFSHILFPELYNKVLEEKQNKKR